MSDRSTSRVGRVPTADIVVPEHEREARFYSRVLCTGSSPLWRDDLMNSRGQPIIGLAPLSPEYGALPLQWMPHVQVADVAASAQRAVDLNGTELIHGRDADGKSQWAVLLDPQGAAFGVMPVSSVDASPRTEGDTADEEAAPGTGCIAWLELTVPDPAAICDFYRQVIGWSVRQVEEDDASGPSVGYTLLGADGEPAAGVRPARGGNPGVPPVWLLHLPVGDLAESLRRVRDEGGEILETRQGPDGGDAWAAIRDPVGACLALVRG